jgi:hypothetical protein
MKKFLVAAAGVAALAISCASAQTLCRGAALTGTVRDSTQALIPGATVTLDGAKTVTSGSDGSFRFACVGDGTHRLTAAAVGFAGVDVSVKVPLRAALNVVLKPEDVQTQVSVSAGEGQEKSAISTGPSLTIYGKALQGLADDPDDLLRELQEMAAMSGGSPSGTTIAVDGFDSGEGGAKLPPKSSIAYIKVNPDLFSAEYREPPFGGGRVEVYTKPGQSTYHGALYGTNGSPWMNARDPFSTSRAAIGKQRYGFDLTGPIRKVGSDFTVSLEHRSIDDFAVVNAVTVDAAGDESSLVQNVATPQRLWVGTARVDWQLGAKNTFIATFNASVNHLQNVGVGGTSLAETGYNSEQTNNTLHLTDVTTVSPKLMHEQLLDVEWNDETDMPNSTAPQLQVAGAFTSGGATIGNERMREVDVEDTDDAILTTKNHLMKFGLQSSILDEHFRLSTNFNGTYTFGGGTVAGAPITGVQQYVLALNGAPGGSPTDYSNVAGNPEVDLVQLRFALYFQDSWKIRPNLTAAYGVRYYTQSDPTVTDSLVPRFGIAYSPGEKAKWTIHAHAGMFNGIFHAHDWAEILRMDGVQRVTSTVYNPVCPGTFSTASCNPFVGATPIESIRTVQPKLPNMFFAIQNIGFTRALPKGWNLSADYYLAQIWHYTRTENVNSPTNDSPTGPRPGPANLNILQLQSSGRGYGNVEFAGLEQHSLKYVKLFAGAVRVDIVDDTDDNIFSTPQTTGVNAGEYARRDNNPLWNVFGNATITLPEKLQLSGNFNAQGQQAYNVTTGFDNNGDGDFNDRPQYAAPGTPGAVQTPWGLLVASGGTGSLPRDKGQMPWVFHLDVNLERAFQLTNPKGTHPQTLTVNLRSSNVLNHLNVTAVGGVLGSPLFEVPYQADNGRRVEVGARYSF